MKCDLEPRVILLQADFRSDLITVARNSLTSGWDSVALQIPEDDLLIWFFDTLRRRPAVRQRGKLPAKPWDSRYKPRHDGH